MEATHAEGQKISLRPRAGCELKGVRFPHRQGELHRVQGMQDHLGEVGSVLGDNVSLSWDSTNLDIFGRDGDFDILWTLVPAIATVATWAIVVGREEGSFEPRFAEAQSVVQGAACGRIQVEGSDRSDGSPSQAVVLVCWRSLDDNFGADVISRNLVHVRGDSRNVHKQVAHPSLPNACQRYWQATSISRGCCDQNARLKEATTFDAKLKMKVEVAGDSSLEVLLLGSVEEVRRRQQQLRNSFQAAPNLHKC
mmetsp:Transcript_9420/g.20440  ORF Transcript_9420/g.20440 Transcript_9420/m.20440 type:complete len:252 (-) Transcript_9420:121-876(-)